MTAHYPDLADKVHSFSVTGFEAHQPARHSLYRSTIKRLIDIVAVLATVVVTLPVVLLMAFCVSLDGNAPFYAQKRVGKGGRIFTMWKLRSMIPGADAKLEAYLATDPEARAEWDRTQKLKKDPRITRVGRILRKSSVDELPQLWNVLKGDMSLVGPRPMMPDQAPLYPGTAYYALRPGITGTWQVSARNESSFADRARFDNDYDRRVSLSTDMAILLATVRVVMHATGH